MTPAAADRRRAAAHRDHGARRPRAAATSRPGFTLFEMLVALTITGLIISATYAAISTAVGAAERNRATERQTHRDRNAHLLLTSLLRSAHVDLAADPQGFRALPAADAPSGHQELHFVSSLGFPFAGFPSHEHVRAHLRLGPGQPGARPLLLTLESAHPGAAARREHVPLFDDLEAITISFRAPGDDAWRDRWDSRVAVPAALHIEFEGPRPRPSILVNLPLAPAR